MYFHLSIILNICASPAHCVDVVMPMIEVLAKGLPTGMEMPAASIWKGMGEYFPDLSLNSSLLTDDIVLRFC